MEIPRNVEVVNGHWLCFEPDGKVSLFTPGEGFWGFWLPEDSARQTASIVCGGICVNCGCEIRQHDNEDHHCDKCGCVNLITEVSRANA